MEYKVIQVDPFNVTEEDALNIKNLFKDGDNYMVTSYAAPLGSRDPVNFTYQVNIKNSNKKEKKTKTK